MFVVCRHGISLVLVRAPSQNMNTKKSGFAKLTVAGCERVIEQANGSEVFHVSSSHALIQAAGYLKHTIAASDSKGVFFRGQTELFGGLSPSLFRGVRDGPGTVARLRRLEAFLQQIETDKKALRAVDPSCREALLQHYGVRTTWLDVVDNVWIALWFACHKALTLGWPEEYLHFERRVPAAGRSGAPDFVYVLLLASASFSSQVNHPGHYRDSRSETIDLRVAVPSHFLRPHAQHGILVRRLSKAGKPVSDFSPLHVGTIRADLSAALSWLGEASTLTTHSLFPPAYYDFGYLELMKGINTKDHELGSIHRVQP